MHHETLALKEKTREELLQEIEDLRARLQDEQEYSRAIRNGEIDALVVSGPAGEQVYTLKEADRPYRIIIEEMNEGTVTLSEDGIILYSNKQFARMLDLPLSRLVGTSLYTYVDTSFRHTVETLMSARDSETRRAEMVFMAPGPRKIYANVSFSLLEIDQAPVFCCVITDVTGERKVLEELQNTNALLERIFDNTHIMVAYMDKDCNFIRVNHAFASACGLDPELFGGRSFFDIYPGHEDRAIFSQVVDSGEVYSAVEKPFACFQQPRGAIYSDWNLQPVKGGDGHVQGIILTLVDRTDRRKAEQERRLLEQQVNQMQKMEALGRLAGGIAHDLNNVLYPIIINTEMLLAGEESADELGQSLQQILTAAYRQRDLVKQILAFSRRSDQQMGPVRVIPLMQEAIRFIRASLPATIEIRNSIQARSDLILGDGTQVHQVIMNLCSNAADAIGSHPGMITVSLDEAHLDAPRLNLRPGNYLRLVIGDTGQGIPREVMEHIFEPFFTTKEVGRGSGMGLSVVHGIIENHGGSITVESEPGKGSRFIVFLPQLQREYQQQAASADCMSPAQGRKILLVDDEVPVLTSVQRALGRLGYDVCVARDTDEALDLFEDAPEGFDLVITDQTMPHMTGVQLAEEVMRMRPGLPVILCTGFSEVISEQEAKSMGIREILMKPATMKDLNDAVRRALES